MAHKLCFIYNTRKQFPTQQFRYVPKLFQNRFAQLVESQRYGSYQHDGTVCWAGLLHVGCPFHL